MWSRMSSTQQAEYAHCPSGLDLMHCHTAQHACSSDLDRGRVEVKRSLDLDSRSASDPDPRSCVESLYMKSLVRTHRNPFSASGIKFD